MERTAHAELVGRVIDQHARRTTTLADSVRHIPVDRYVSEDHFAREQRTLFRTQPVFACMSADIPNPGDAFTFESGGVPIAVVRASDGSPCAYVNVCRHRGSTVVPHDARALHSFSCPFHGWIYDRDDGHLVGRPRSCDGFAELDADCMGLRRLAASEDHGVIAVRPDSDEPIDLNGWLAGLGPEIGSLDYAALMPHCSERTVWQCNWKLLLDTFLESYHVPALHKTSLASFYLGIASPFDAFGPHNRIVVPQSSILGQAEVPPEQRDLMAHAVLQYFLAPNIIFSNLYGYVMTWRFVPSSAGRTTVHHSLYTYGQITTDEERARFDERFDAARSVTGNEDFPESEVIHRNLASGALAETVAGRNEPGMIHFHGVVDAAVSAR
jgi:phenylpropionate dioxygenase-like ring-hydroxylating dioxygenase large terminal subunit